MKNKFKFESTRKFVVVSYAVGHGLLLLRSGKTQHHPKRIDILFQDVRAMELRCLFEGVIIEEMDAILTTGFRSNPAQMIDPENKLYSVKGQGWEGFIAGGIVSTMEDDKEFMAPSDLILKHGRL